MSDQAAFITKIVENPADNTPRLVFADWLEENGESERAEFIRVQIELSRRDVVAACSCHSRDLCAECSETRRLGRLEKRLKGDADPGAIFPNVDRWFYREFPLSSLGAIAEISRGFVSAVRCRLADWVGRLCPVCEGRGWLGRDEYCRACDMQDGFTAHGPRIVAEHPVERVEITDVRFLHNDPAGDIISFGYLDELALEPLRSELGKHLLNWARCKAGLPPLPAPSRDLGRVAV